MNRREKIIRVAVLGALAAVAIGGVVLLVSPEPEPDFQGELEPPKKPAATPDAVRGATTSIAPATGLRAPAGLAAAKTEAAARPPPPVLRVTVPDAGPGGSSAGPPGSEDPRITTTPPSRPADPELDAGSKPRTIHKLDLDGIRTAVRESLPEMKECYDEWLKTNPSLAGKLAVAFTVVTDPDKPTQGKITEVNLGDTAMGHVMMEGCVLSVFSDLRFEAPKDGKLSVKYPVTFANDPPAPPPEGQ